MIEGDQAPFFDREQELRILTEAWLAPGSQLLTLWGRRRVGKSTLMARFAADKRAVYLYGTRLPERALLDDLAAQAAQVFDEPFLLQSPFANWMAALDHLATRARTQRLLLILDEFPYLCEASPGLDTLVQRWWDQRAAGANLLLVLAGSGFSAMRALTGVTGPLHGRRTGQVEVHPFDYLDAARFYPHLNPADRVRAYACLGGLPAYLRHCRPAEPLPDLLRRTLLAPGHALFSEGEDLLRIEFHHEALYAAILRATARAPERPSAIARAVGRSGVAEIADALRRLQELRFLRREVPITEPDQGRSARSLYRLADPYLRCWFSYVSPARSLLQLGQAETVWTRTISPTLDEFVARTTWEEVVQQHLWRRVASSRLPVLFGRLGRWWNDRDEIDLIGLWEGQATLVGECKWTNAPLADGDLLRLQQKARALPLAERPLWVLASRTGFAPSLQRRVTQGDLLLLTPTDLYGDDSGLRQGIEPTAPER